MRLVIFPFFGAALGGMAIGRLAEQGAWASAQDIWGRVIGFTVGGVLVLGFFMGVMGAAYGGGPLGLIKEALVAVREVVIKVVGWALTPIVGALFDFILWLRDRFNPNPPPPLELETGAFRPTATEPGELPEDSTESLIEMIAQILAYPAAALLILLVLWLMIRGFKKMQQNRTLDPSDERESIRGDSDARRDLADLFYRLLPGFMRGGIVGKSSRRYPTDEPGITEVFLLYFRYLEAGVRGGASLDSNLTPSEMEGRIAEALPGAPVGLMTARFEAACYGHEPSSEEDLRTLTSGLGEDEVAED